MPGKVLASPPATSEDWLLADWLELSAFLSRFGEASIDDIISTRGFQEDDAEEDIGSKDAQEEELRDQIENEIRHRADALTTAYPFALSDDGEQLLFTGQDDLIGPYASYLVCLILSHVTQSPILSTPPKPEMVREARKRIFQIIATLAAAGHAQGGAVSLGWPRETKESIIDVVRRAVAASQTGNARAQPLGIAPQGAKDGGLDVLAWKDAPDGPPPENFFFVQAASGHNWEEKSAKGDYEQFLTCYFDVSPGCNIAFITICPFRLSADKKDYATIAHGLISDRTRAPARVRDALEAAAQNDNHAIDEVKNFAVLSLWLRRYRKENRV